MSAGRLLLIVVVGVILAAAIINGLRGAAGQRTQPTTPTYQVVPCSSHPEAYGCRQVIR